MKKEIQVRDRVQYKAAFLRSIGAFTGALPFAKGTVTAISEAYGPGRHLVTVDWDHEEAPPRVLECNLKRVCDYEPN